MHGYFSGITSSLVNLYLNSNGLILEKMLSRELLTGRPVFTYSSYCLSNGQGKLHLDAKITNQTTWRAMKPFYCRRRGALPHGIYPRSQWCAVRRIPRAELDGILTFGVQEMPLFDKGLWSFLLFDSNSRSEFRINKTIYQLRFRICFTEWLFMNGAMHNWFDSDSFWKQFFFISYYVIESLKTANYYQ